ADIRGTIPPRRGGRPAVERLLPARPTPPAIAHRLRRNGGPVRSIPQTGGRPAAADLRSSHPIVLCLTCRCPAQFPAGHHTAIRKHRSQVQWREQHPREDSPQAGVVLVLNVLMDLGLSLAEGAEGVGVLPP